MRFQIPEDIIQLKESYDFKVMRNPDSGSYDYKVKRIRIPEDIIQFTRVFIGLSQILLAVIKINI